MPFYDQTYQQLPSCHTCLHQRPHVQSQNRLLQQIHLLRNACAALDGCTIVSVSHTNF
jgi:hypothetical protein